MKPLSRERTRSNQAGQTEIVVLHYDNHQTQKNENQSHFSNYTPGIRPVQERQGPVKTRIFSP